MDESEGRELLTLTERVQVKNFYILVKADEGSA